MAFSINIVTSAGANLIAQATSSNPIVFVDCYCGNTAAQDAQDLASKDVSFYSFGGGYSDGTIFSASAQDNVARIIMSFNSKHCELNEPEYIKSACIRAKLQSQTDADAVIMAALSDPDSEVMIPSVTSPEINIHIPINIAINADNQIAAVGAEYASMADLARFVSMYKAGNPNAGDNQTIKGNKTFTGQTSFDDTVFIDSNLTVDNDIINNGELTSQMMHSSYILVKDDNTYTDRVNTNYLGVALEDGEIITYGAYAQQNDTMMSGVAVWQNSKYQASCVRSQVVIDNANSDKVIICDLFYEDDQAYIENKVYNTDNYSITSDYTDYTQGGFYYRWEIYKNNANDGFRYEWDDEEAEFCLMPLAGNTGSLGAETCRWGKGYFDSINFNSGFLPHPTRQTGSTGITTPIGSIVMLYVYNLDMAYNETVIGSTITSAANHACYSAPYSSANKQMYVNGLVFVALQSIDWVVSGSYHEAAFLAMRVG